MPRGGEREKVSMRGIVGASAEERDTVQLTSGESLRTGEACFDKK